MSRHTPDATIGGLDGLVVARTEDGERFRIEVVGHELELVAVDGDEREALSPVALADGLRHGEFYAPEGQDPMPILRSALGAGQSVEGP